MKNIIIRKTQYMPCPRFTYCGPMHTLKITMRGSPKIPGIFCKKQYSKDQATATVHSYFIMHGYVRALITLQIIIPVFILRITDE